MTQNDDTHNAAHCTEGNLYDNVQNYQDYIQQAPTTHLHIVGRLHVSFSPMTNSVVTRSAQYIMMDQFTKPDSLDECQLTLTCIMKFCEIVQARLNAHERPQLVLVCGLLPSMQSATTELLGCYLISTGSDVNEVHNLLQSFELGRTFDGLSILDRWASVWHAKHNSWIWSSPDDDDEHNHYARSAST
jgi:hypothetical protein